MKDRAASAKKKDQKALAILKQADKPKEKLRRVPLTDFMQKTLINIACLMGHGKRRPPLPIRDMFTRRAVNVQASAQGENSVPTGDLCVLTFCPESNEPIGWVNGAKAGFYARDGSNGNLFLGDNIGAAGGPMVGLGSIYYDAWKFADPISQFTGMTRGGSGTGGVANTCAFQFLSGFACVTVTTAYNSTGYVMYCGRDDNPAMFRSGVQANRVNSGIAPSNIGMVIPNQSSSMHTILRSGRKQAMGGDQTYVFVFKLGPSRASWRNAVPENATSTDTYRAHTSVNGSFTQCSTQYGNPLAGIAQTGSYLALDFDGSEPKVAVDVFYDYYVELGTQGSGNSNIANILVDQAVVCESDESLVASLQMAPQMSGCGRTKEDAMRDLRERTANLMKSRGLPRIDPLFPEFPNPTLGVPMRPEREVPPPSLLSRIGDILSRENIETATRLMSNLMYDNGPSIGGLRIL